MNWQSLRRTVSRAIFFALLMALAVPPPAPLGWAQDNKTAKPPEQPAPQKDSTDQTQEPQPFKLQPVIVQRVTTPVTVFDSGGQLVYDLEQNEFKIYDNGVQQDITDFDSEMRRLSMVIVVETNDATAPFLDSVRPLGSMFSDAIMGPKGEVALLTYSDHIDTALDFTSNGDKLDTALRAMQGRAGGMHMDDALLRALSMLISRPIEDRKVVIVFSDGYNIGSKMSRSEIVKGAMNSNITVYGLGFSPVKGLWKREPKDPAPNMINESVARSMPPGAAATPTMASNIYDSADINIVSILLGLGEEAKKPLFKSSLQYFARYSGGAYFQKWGKDTVQAALNEIGTEIHSQYELAYAPQKPVEVGFHTIKVEVRRPGAKVRARSGWFYQGADVPRNVVVH